MMYPASIGMQLHLLQAVVSFTLGLIGVHQDRSNALLAGHCSHLIVAAFPTFTAALTAYNKGACVAAET